jgi:hypothetical protein
MHFFEYFQEDISVRSRALGYNESCIFDDQNSGLDSWREDLEVGTSWKSFSYHPPSLVYANGANLQAFFNNIETTDLYAINFSDDIAGH